MLSAIETAVKPLSLRLSVSLSLALQLDGGGGERGGGLVMKQVFLSGSRGLSGLHTADLCHLLPPAGGLGATGVGPGLAGH